MAPICKTRRDWPPTASRYCSTKVIPASLTESVRSSANLHLGRYGISGRLGKHRKTSKEGTTQIAVDTNQMRTNINMIHRITSFVLLASSVCAAQEIRTVIAEGVGSNPQNAAQDAAQNALTNVVGSFLDANKQLEKRTEIRDGIRSQTTQIKSDVKEYSQGSIQSFDIIETKPDGPLFRVTAKVGVRVAEFRAYVKKLAEGEVAVSGGLFAEMTTTQKQSESLAKILSERLLAVVTGEAVRFSVGKPVPFRRSPFADANSRANGRQIGSLSSRFSPDQLAVFEVTATLDGDFLENLVQTLDSVTASKTRVSTSAATNVYNFWNTYSNNGSCEDPSASSGDSRLSERITAQRVGGRIPLFAKGVELAGSGATNRSEHPNISQNANPPAASRFCLPLMDHTPGTATVYRFSNVDHELEQNLPWVFDFADSIIRGTVKVPRLEVAVLDRDKHELQVELVHGRGDQGEKTALAMEYPWLLYYPVSPYGIYGTGAALLRQRTFSVVMKIEDDALKQADSIRVRLVK